MTTNELKAEHERLVAQYESARDSLNQLLGGILYLKKLIQMSEASDAKPE